VRRSVLSSHDGNIAYSALLLGRLKVKQEKFAEAEPLLREARDVFREHYGNNPGLAAQAENWLGTLQLRKGNLAEAKALVLPGLDVLLSPETEMSPQERKEVIGHGIELHQALGEPDTAVTWQTRWERFHEAESLQRSAEAMGRERLAPRTAP
jgi:hypothetical protein